jgi:hypothetical protein
MVYLKLQPHIQSFVAPRSNYKLSYRFYGPFKIIQKIGQVAYKLDLPAHAQIHPVVHVSQLKKHVPPQAHLVDDITTISIDNSVDCVPLKVLARELLPKAGSSSYTLG